MTAAEVHSSLQEFLPSSREALEVWSEEGRQGKEGEGEEDPMHTFLHMSEDEFASALEMAMDRKGWCGVVVHGVGAGGKGSVWAYLNPELCM